MQNYSKARMGPNNNVGRVSYNTGGYGNAGKSRMLNGLRPNNQQNGRFQISGNPKAGGRFYG